MTYVYGVRAVGTNFIKIGVASDVAKRRKGIAVGCPFPVVVEWVVQFRTRHGAMYAEKSAHRSMHRRRTSGEWFWVTAAESEAARSTVQTKGSDLWDDGGMRDQSHGAVALIEKMRHRAEAAERRADAAESRLSASVRGVTINPYAVDYHAEHETLQAPRWSVR